MAMNRTFYNFKMLRLILILYKFTRILRFEFLEFYEYVKHKSFFRIYILPVKYNQVHLGEKVRHTFLFYKQQNYLVKQ